jgi:hypothetical protein
MRDTSASFTCRTLVLALAAVGSVACAESDKTPISDQDAGDVSANRSERSAASTAADSGTRNARDNGRDAATDSRSTPDASTARESDNASKDAAAARPEDAAAPRGEDAATPQADAATPQADAATPQADAAIPEADAASPQSQGDASTARQSCAPIDKIDLLLMVDNSNSMAGEQASLKNAFPGLIEALTSGRRFPGDPTPFPAIRDLHVDVVSSDMGIPGVELPPSCSADGGDDGRLQNSSVGENCDGNVPLWLSFSDSAPNSPGDVTKFANDLRCTASLGTGGCGFEQQLESPLKALWPKGRLLDVSGAEIPNPFRFISTTEQGTWGRGDLPIAEGGNLGFLRPATDLSPSLLVVVAVTDEDDCSVKATDHLRPNNQLPEGSPLRAEDINLRCFNHKEFLFDLRDRYYTAFRALRTGMEDRVMFAAIAGVPADLVSSEALAEVDFDSTDPASRQAFYSAVLADERMQDRVDPATMPGSGQGNLTTSCARFVDNEPAPSSAFPPRRIVQLAQLFDQNSTIQSICQDDFTVPTQGIVNMIARRLARTCDAP